MVQIDQDCNLLYLDRTPGNILISAIVMYGFATLVNKENKTKV